MEDIKSRIDKLNREKNINFYLFLITFIFLFALSIWAIPQADTDGEKVLLLYIMFNLLTSLVIAFQHVKVIRLESADDQLMSYYKKQIDRTIISNDMAPLVYNIPLIFSLMGIWAIDISQDKDPVEWIYIVFSILWLFGVFRWWKMRKLIRKEYKKIHGIDFLSFLHF